MALRLAYNNNIYYYYYSRYLYPGRKELGAQKQTKVIWDSLEEMHCFMRVSWNIRQSAAELRKKGTAASFYRNQESPELRMEDVGDGKL